MRDARQPSALRAGGFAVCARLAVHVILACVVSLGLLMSMSAQAGYRIGSPSATLTWDNGATGANVVVTRFEDLGLYRYDPVSGTNVTVYSSDFASADSLSGVTPTTTTPLPPALDGNGTTIGLDQPVPLTQTNSLRAGETLFLQINQPQLPASAFGNRSDGRRIMGVTIRALDANNISTDFVIALVETNIGSNLFTGYLPTTGLATDIAEDSSLELVYDDYIDLVDSQATLPPYSVDSAVVDSLVARRFALITGTPDPRSGAPALFLAKQAVRTLGAQGDVIPYQLKITNNGTGAASNVIISDQLPAGFRLREGSVRVGGLKVAAEVNRQDGRKLTIPVGTVSPDTEVLVEYVADITAIAQPGKAVNTAVASADGGHTSNTAEAIVVVERAFFNDRAVLMGRVIVGECGDRSGKGLEDVRLYLEDGSSVMTDSLGRYHLEGLKPGTHVIQLDEASLGPRYSLQSCQTSPRQAGKAASRFVEVQGGTLWREEFFLSEKPVVTAHIEQQLLTEVSAGIARIRLPIGNGETVFENVSVQLYLPDSLSPVPGTARLDNESVADPVKGENYYTIELQPKGQYWNHELTLDLLLDPGTIDGDLKTIMARTTGTTPDGKRHTVVSQNEVSLVPAVMKDANLTLRPQFPTMSATLSEDDVLTVRQAAAFLKAFHAVELEVIGHTDSVPVRRREGRLVNSNQALSEARAQAVADVLLEELDLEADAIVVSGRGPREPVADNNLESGRALNRRVEVKIRTRERVADAQLTLVNGDSGKSRAGSTAVTTEKAPEPGINNLVDGMKVSLPVISVTGTLDARLKPRLMLNGTEIPSSRMAMKLEDADGKLTHYTWLGIELPQTGDYELELQGVGPFGNTRYSEKVGLTRTSNIKEIRAGNALPNIADGKTPVRVKLQLIDESGRPIESRTDLRLLSGDLQPLDKGVRADRLSKTRDIVEVDAQGYAWFEPVSNAGNYRIRLGNDSVSSDVIEVSVAPHLRDWILVGFAKGSVGYSTLEDNLDNIPDAEKDVYTDGEAVFFAKGRIKGDWLLTMSYDSRKESGDAPLGGQFRPDQWYTLYGDNTERQHEAASQEKLYVRIERQDFYALFGDFDTGLTVTELGRYQRTLTGFKSEYQGRNLSSNVFASQTDQGFGRVDINGDGTSGLYRIGRGDILAGSEVVRIEVRDRFNNEIISSESRSRFADYTIDYQDGTLFFREPIPVQDENFNPVFIVVEFEIDAGRENLSGGGRVAIHDSDKSIELGLTAVREGTEGQEGNIAAADLTWRPDEKHTIKAESASTRQSLINGPTRQDNAWLVEHTYLSEKLDTRLRLQEQGEEFGLGQQSSSEGGIRQSSLQARYRITENYILSSEARRQERASVSETRDSLEARIEYDKEPWKAYGGLRSARDEIGAQSYHSELLTGGVSRRLLDDRLTLSATGETGISSSENNDYPNRLGMDADYRINRVASLFAAQEFVWSDEYRAQESRAGVRTTPWKGGTLTTDLGHSQDEFGPRLFAHAGLYQNLQLSNQWSADFGFDRAQTLKETVRNDSFDDARRVPASGTNSEDYTAIAAGLGYQTSDWQWTNRIEHRLSDYSDKWNLLSGFNHRLDSTNTLLGRFQHRDENVHGGADEWETELDFSLVHRPSQSDWWVLNRSRLILDGLESNTGSLKGRRLVNNTTANFNPNSRHQLAMMYGARYVLDTINGERYDGYTDLISAEYRFDLTRYWDLGARASTLRSHQSGARDDSYGVMVGLSPVEDVWISLGYNFRGFYDSDFDQANSRVAGIVLDFRIKFDQGSARRWRGEE